MRAKTFNDLPLFASDSAISEALMGPGKVREWLAILPLLDRRGFPGIDGLMGWRYTPAVKAFFDREWKIHGSTNIRDPRGGEERLGSWKGRRQRPVET
jgi:hypothetical protein